MIIKLAIKLSEEELKAIELDRGVKSRFEVESWAVRVLREKLDELVFEYKRWKVGKNT